MQYHLQYLLVLTSCPDESVAEQIALSLVEQQLAACIQVSAPNTAFYRWQGKVVKAKEVALQIKCLADSYKRLQQTVIAMHPYDVPELIAVPISDGLPDYLDWIKENSQP